MGNGHLHIHTKQGVLYLSRIRDLYDNVITPSRSRKENPYDNAMAEHFFSALKTECIYRFPGISPH